MNRDLIVIVICVLSAAFGIYREYQRAISRNMIWRIIAVSLAATSLACIALSVSYPADPVKTKANQKILLTTGFNTNSLASSTDSVYTLDRTIAEHYPKALLIADISELFANGVGQPRILGYGLDKSELDELKGRGIQFYFPPPPAGIIAANWTGDLRSGDQFNIQLKYNNTSTKAHSLILKGGGITLDSMIVSANSVKNIELSTRPKYNGRIVYDLLALDNADTLEAERIPVTIEPAQPIKVLILSASPDFETKFLRGWLGKNGYGVATRTTISKNKFSQEYSDTEQIDLTHLSNPLLDKFDVLISDLSLLKELNATENAALKQQVSQKGLGIIIRVDSVSKKRSWFENDLTLTHFTGKKAGPVSPDLQGKGKTSKLNIDPIYINKTNNAQTLVTDGQDHLLAVASLAGAGKLVHTTISNSHNWLLAGYNDDYSKLWSLLISKAVRKGQATANWEIDSDIPMIDEPARMAFETGSAFNKIRVDQTDVYAAQDPLVSFQQIITYWPNTAGWQQAMTGTGKPFWWYAWNNYEWKGLTAANKLRYTAKYAKEHVSSPSVTKQIQYKTRLPVPKIWFFILFLVAATFLWAESKFTGR